MLSISFQVIKKKIIFLRTFQFVNVMIQNWPGQYLIDLENPPTALGLLHHVHLPVRCTGKQPVHKFIRNIYLSIYLSVYLSIYLILFQSYLFECLCVFDYLSLCLSVCLLSCLSVTLCFLHLMRKVHFYAPPL